MLQDQRSYRSSDNLILILMFLTVFVSVYLHGVLMYYSDIYSILLDRSRGDTIYGIPYIDFRFEYPPLVGGLWALSSLITRIIHTEDPVRFHMYMLFTFNALFYVAYVYAISRLLRYVGGDMLRTILSISSFSMVYYLMYNWDIVAVSLALLSLLYMFRDRYILSSILAALSVLAKVFTAPLFLALLYYSYKKNDLTRGFKALILSLFIVLGVVSLMLVFIPRIYDYFFVYHSNWYCENCFYILFTDNIWDPGFRILSMVLMLVVPLLVSATIMSFKSPLDTNTKVYTLSFLSIASLISFSYVYSPQMNIMILPLYLVLKGLALIMMIASDFLNMLIMVLWFKTDLFTQYLGIPPSDPHLRTSPIQWISFTRIVLLWIVIITTLYNIRKK
ncbi:MAG: hypothetical protein QXQ36_01000 [Sulfolobales archaeon]